MGLFERTKHLERLAREIADQNLRQLGSKEARVDKEETRKQVLELEAVLREYRLHLEEAEAEKEIAASREETARAKAAEWLENAALAREKQKEDLAAQASQRAQVYERERETAHADVDRHNASVQRLGSEIASVEKRIAVIRALRKGGSATLPALTPTQRITKSGTTTRITAPRKDPLEQAFDDLKGDDLKDDELRGGDRRGG